MTKDYYPCMCVCIMSTYPSTSAFKSLMQYRFKKDNVDKLKSVSATKDADNVTCIPQTPSPCQSPIFKGKATNVHRASSSPVQKKKYSRVIIPDSDSDESDVDTQSKHSSPWLSKQGGVINNGHVSSSVTDIDDWSSQGSSSAGHVSSSYKSQANHDSFSCKLHQLQNIFPHKPRYELEAAIEDTPNLEAAINVVMGIETVKAPNKRQRGTGTSVAGQPKRRRIIANDHMSSDEDGDGEAPAVSAGDVEKVSFLKEAYPNLDHKVLTTTLKKHNWSIERATSALVDTDVIEIESSDEEELPDMKTAMNGASIRSLQKEQRKNFINHKKSKKLCSTTADNDSFRVQYGTQNDSCEELIDDDDEDAGESDGSLDDESSNLSHEKQMLLSFFNDAVVEELITMPGCSKKKAEIIDSVRPFTSWDDMCDKLASTKGLNIQLLTGCKQLIYIREDICKLMARCEKIADEMEGIVSDLMDQVDLSESEGHINRQPRLLNSDLQLKPYQMVGLNWLMLIHRQELNGILADEMGLGKTVQAIAFLTYLLENGDKGPHVIIVPSSTLDNWLRELKTWSPSMKVVLYYGSQEDRRNIRYNLQECGEEYDVMVTTYNVATGSLEDRAFFKKFVFHYAVLDEAHMVKNMSTLRYQNLMKMKAKRRLLLTGTPLQNNLVELMSLLCFVMPDMFIGKTDQLKQLFTTITRKAEDSKSAYEKERIRHAKQIMKPFVLRRLKTEVLRQLPKKTVHMEFCPLTCEQEDIYNSAVQRITAEVQKNEWEKVVSNSNSMMMQLRKVACHPLLMRTRYTSDHLRTMAKLLLRDPSHQDANPDLIYEDMEVMSDFELHKTCKLYPVLRDFTIDNDSITDSAKLRYLDDILPSLKVDGSRVLIFSQFTMMLDILEDYLKINKHKYFRLDGQTAVTERQELIDKFNTDSSVFAFLLSTRAGGLGINLTAANVVIIHDLDFNPHNDKQAEDRCHRVGQSRDVTVHRLITKNTIEEAILRCAESKLQLEKDMNCNTETDTQDEKPSDVASLLKQALGV